MFYIEKTLELSCSHQLNLPYKSKCSNLHGHGLLVTIHCASEELDENGMVVDFIEIKKKVMDTLDHKYLNDIEGIGYEMISKDPPEGVGSNPTAERIAKWICEQIPKCYKVSVQESTGNIAIYVDPAFKNSWRDVE